jgi:hypothetical protein
MAVFRVLADKGGVDIGINFRFLVILLEYPKMTKPEPKTKAKAQRGKDAKFLLFAFKPCTFATLR